MSTDPNRSKSKYLLPVALAAEPIFEVAGFTVTNAMLNAYIAVAFFIFIAFIASRRKSLVPKGIHNILEALVEF
ncbi:hypothetical protein IH979_03425, partial [Patescibacteria group bacterium]|nr:hypothetical protein [Patescibacteria group bacterium]